jgi:hypothetical protein
MLLGTGSAEVAILTVYSAQQIQQYLKGMQHFEPGMSLSDDCCLLPSLKKVNPKLPSQQVAQRFYRLACGSIVFAKCKPCVYSQASRLFTTTNCKQHINRVCQSQDS